MSERTPSILQEPDLPRHIRLPLYQKVGLLILLLVPLLAIAGIFGETTGEAEATGPDVSLQVVYKSKYRYKQINAIQVFVRNVSSQPLDTVVVAFDPAYVRQFSTLTFIPSPQIPFEIEFTGLKPGETRLVWAELQGEAYGYHRGDIKAYRSGSTDTTRVQIGTMIYP